MSESMHFPALLSSPSGVAGHSDLPGTALSEVSLPSPVAEDTETRTPVRIAEADRCGGVYVLGRPRTGKSTLLISLALADIDRGHGILFIDPHMDAINDLIARIPENRLQDVILLDPTDKTRSFGINLLRCDNHNDPIEIDKTYGRVKNIFAKVWGGEKGQLGIWLDKVLRNSVYLLLENPGYTIVDISLLVEEDTRFRDFLLENVKVKPYVRDFWLKEFDRLSKRDKIEQVGPALSRLDVFRNTTIRHFVGQVRSTIDFPDIINGIGRPRIVLLRMPGHFYDDEQEIIGTILLGEVLQAVYTRDKLPIERRRYFGIFCDEFQDFATPDFAKLFTETGKFNAMPVVAHHERVGQFGARDENRGATGAAPNKIFFSLTPADAGEVAPEFAKEPPAETTPEEQFVISQNPIDDLLRGHSNAQIRGFVSRYLRPLQERIEDIKEHMEEDRLIRDDQHDLAAIERVEAQMMGVYYYRSQHYAALERVISFLLFARAQTAKLLNLHRGVKELRSVIRGFNRFLSAIMEGSIAQGQEQFSQFLIRIIQVSEFSLVPQQYAPALELYISLKYGDSKAPRAIPFALAREEQVFSSEVALLTHQAEEEFKHEKETVWQQIWKHRIGRCLEYAAEEPERAKEYQEKVLELIYQIESELKKENRRESAYRLKFSKFACRFTLIYHYPSLAELFNPYYTARFAASWRDRLPDVAKTLSWMLDWIEDQRERAEHGLKYFKHYNPPPGWFKEWFISGPAYDSNPEGDLYDIDLLNWLEQFLKRHGEGAIVILVLLMSLAWPKRWFSSWCYSPNYSSAYNMLYVPALMNKEPLEVLLFLNKVSDFISRLDVNRDCRKYMWECLDWYGYCKYDWARGAPRERFSSWYNEDDFYSGKKWSMEVTNELEEHPDIKLLGQLLSKTDSQHSVLQERWWKTLEKLARLYLMSRACYLVRFGQKIVDKAFPQPTIQGVSPDKISSVVTFMADALQEEISRQLNQIQQGNLAKLKFEAQKEFDSEMSHKSMSLPVRLPYRQLSENEIELLKRVCVTGLLSSKDWDGKATLTIIEEFVQFCTLLSKPENHIKIRSRQYVEKPIRTRTEIDMVNEMVRELINLDPYFAYARFARTENGRKRIVVQKIRTLKLSTSVGEMTFEERSRLIESASAPYYLARQRIEEEIRARQERWRQPVAVESPPAPSEGEKQAEKQGAGESVMDDGLPPAPSEGGEEVAGEGVAAPLPSSGQSENPPPVASIGEADPEDPPLAGVSQDPDLWEPLKHFTGGRQRKDLLIYRSDFSVPSDKWWEGEYAPDRVRAFRHDGDYHIAVDQAPCHYYFFLDTVVSDFRLTVNSRLVRSDGKSAACGVVFRLQRSEGRDSYYRFLITQAGDYNLYLFRNGDSKRLLGSSFCDCIKRDGSFNSLMVQMIKDALLIGINGQIAAAIRNDRLLSGKVGLTVAAYTSDGYAEAAFRDIQLYTLE